jgi:hypothetical protein
MVSIDFFTVPTITLKVLFVFIVLEHSRREVLHFNVTDHSTPAWTSSRLSRPSPNTKLRAICCGIGTALMATTFGHVSLRSKSKKSSQSPATPGRIHTEQLIGSIPRDCLDHFIILNARHLKWTLVSYFSCYHGSRTHPRAGQAMPVSRAALGCRAYRSNLATWRATPPLRTCRCVSVWAGTE